MSPLPKPSFQVTLVESAPSLSPSTSSQRAIVHLDAPTAKTTFFSSSETTRPSRRAPASTFLPSTVAPSLSRIMSRVVHQRAIMGTNSNVSGSRLMSESFM